MNNILLSGALIVRNEARHLEECLLSIQDLVDEIVVVDTGSTDASKEIARRLGARLYKVVWRDDFAAARNEALERARGEWILYIDADERVRPTSRPHLGKLLGEPSLVGCYVRLHAHAGYTAYREMRLFRNDSRIRFEGIIHENIWPGIQRYRAARGGKIGDSELVLDHVGYHGAQDHKHRRNLPLLLRELKRNPDHVYCWYHLGLVYRGLGQVERAREAWRSAIAIARRNESQRWADSPAYVELIQLELACGHGAQALLAEALERFPGHAQLHWLKGQALMRDERFDEAIAVFSRLVRWREDGFDRDEAVGYDERLFNELTYERLATCCFRLRRYAESERYFALAAQGAPERLEYRAKRGLCAELAQRAPRVASEVRPTAG
jgi:tetratricopeptide (TPR) repeat protein